jgi:hypothetical protein
MLAFEEDRPRLEVRGRRGDASRAADGGSLARSVEAVVADLRRARRDGGQPLRSLADAARALEVVAAIRQSSLPHAFTRG